MTHREAQALVHPYVDNELTTESAVALLEHCSDCEACNARLKEYSGLKQTLQLQMPRYSVPAVVADAIVTKRTKTRSSAWWLPAVRWGIPLATSFALGVLAMIFVFRPTASSMSATDDLVWDHIRALKSGHLIDVASSDKHTVKPWFAGKTDFSPVVIDLASQGFPLLGARAEYIGGKDIAALVYSNGKHYIGLFEEITDATTPNEAHTFRGYNTLTFAAGEISYSIVSDASADEIQKFMSALENSLGK